MVYLNLSVKDIESAVEFYSEALGMFDFQSDRRLICTLDVPLIIDLHEWGTESHRKHFAQDCHAPASFWIHVGGDDQDSQVLIFDHLSRSNVKFEDVGNLGGHYLTFTDPSRNKFTLHAHLGVFK